MNKVVIGIVAKQYSKRKKRPDVYVRSELKQVIFDNNAIAISILPPYMDKRRARISWEGRLNEKEIGDITSQIKLCDGIILQGGGYSDAYECYIAKYCYKHNIPLLGICAGVMNITRATGGKVKKLQDPDTHNSEEEYVHDITIRKDTFLYELLGTEKIKVNSRHERHIVDKGNLEIVARSDDNVVEVVEAKRKKCFIGVQFHPESLYKIDENMNAIFTYFIDKCKE